MTPLKILWDYRDVFCDGYSITLKLVFSAATLGTTAGFGLAISSLLLGRWVRGFVDITAFVVLSIPSLVILFWLYYPAQLILRTSMSPYTTALAALTLINAFAVYRILLDAVRDLPKQYIVAGLVCGMSPISVHYHISAPLIIRGSLPRWLDQQVVILQTSVFASLISVDEIFRTAQHINSVIYDPIVIYSAMAFIFVTTAGTATYLASRLRHQYFHEIRER